MEKYLKIYQTQWIKNLRLGKSVKEQLKNFASQFLKLSTIS